MRGGSWTLGVVVLLGVAGTSQVVSQEADPQAVSQAPNEQSANEQNANEQNANEQNANQQNADRAPLEVLQDCIEAIEQKDFARYVNHLTPAEQKLQAGAILLLTSQLSQADLAEVNGPDAILLSRVLRDLAARHQLPLDHPARQPHQLPYGYGVSSLGAAVIGGRADGPIREAANVLKSPREFLIEALTEMSRPVVVSGREPQAAPNPFDLSLYTKVYRDLSWTAYTRGDYALAVMAPPTPSKADTTPDAAPQAPSKDESPQLHLDFRKLDGVWKIDRLLPVEMIAPGLGVEAVPPSPVGLSPAAAPSPYPSSR